MYHGQTTAAPQQRHESMMYHCIVWMAAQRHSSGEMEVIKWMREGQDGAVSK